MSEAKIKAIIKRPDEKVGHMTNISASLGNLQRTVDGPIEVLSGPTFSIICNEEGKLRDLPENFSLIRLVENCSYSDTIRGTVIVVGTDGRDIVDCPISLKEWKERLEAWEKYA